MTFLAIFTKKCRIIYAIVQISIVVIGFYMQILY